MQTLLKKSDVKNVGKSSIDSYVSRKKHKSRLKTRELISKLYFHSSGTEAFSDTPSSNSLSSATLDPTQVCVNCTDRYSMDH